MKLSEIASCPSFALLGPGFTGREFVLIQPLAPAARAPRLIYAPYEAETGRELLLAGEISTVSSLEMDEPARPLRPILNAIGHRAAVEEIRESIAAGDVYQVNLTLRATIRDTTGAALLATLLRGSAPRFTAWVRLPDGEEFISASPELLLRMEGRRILCEPMKGTARPGQAGTLAVSEKDRAELNMITDLVRNDLTQICEPRSVRVTCERRLLELPYALQMVSEVVGQLLPGCDELGALRGLHPGGSVTGAPKQAAMQMIRRLERSPRGPYCGVLGLVGGSQSVFSLLIRTASRAGNDWIYGVGGGIVWDSDPDAELEEARLKLGALG